MCEAVAMYRDSDAVPACASSVESVVRSVQWTWGRGVEQETCSLCPFVHTADEALLSPQNTYSSPAVQLDSPLLSHGCVWVQSSSCAYAWSLHPPCETIHTARPVPRPSPTMNCRPHPPQQCVFFLCAFRHLHGVQDHTCCQGKVVGPGAAPRLSRRT